MAKDKDAENVGEDSAKSGRSRLKLIAIILPALLLIGGGVYFFVLSPGSDSNASADASHGEGSEPKPTEKPGEIVTVEPVTINLAGGHYLKVGLDLQATVDAGKHVTPGPAADALISQFSGRTIDELATTEGREEAKKELLEVVEKLYHKEVYEIYYTTFVMN